MAKRKWETQAPTEAAHRKNIKAESNAPIAPDAVFMVQIVTGSYERSLHGIIATISNNSGDGSRESSVDFSDSFLFQPHASAIRCLAISPLSNSSDPNSSDANEEQVILASGGTDERINLYQLSTSPPIADDKFPAVSTLAGTKILENPKNREVGSLLHHSSTITALYFPNRSKLLAASEDNTISVSKTKDWTVVSTIKSPRPKVQGRPSGDTAPVGAGPMGINDFTVHPSMKLMLSVGKGERAMRLWNLVTGRKAGVLNFKRELLESIKEGKYSSGEGGKITWNQKGEEFAVAFERGAIVFEIDSEPKCKVVPSPLTKLHSMKYFSIGLEDRIETELLAVSTEDGRIIFYSTKVKANSGSSILEATILGQLGGKAVSHSGRIKEFQIIPLRDTHIWKNSHLVITCSSDGTVKLWLLDEKVLSNCTPYQNIVSRQEDKGTKSVPQIGKLIGVYETGSRITCMAAFIMREPKKGGEDLSVPDSIEKDENDTTESDSDFNY